MNDTLEQDLIDDENRKKIIFIDDSAYLHRYYFGFPKKQSKFEGQTLEIGALHGLLEFTDKIKKNFKEAEIIHVLDPDNGSQYRKSFHPTYKDRKDKEFELIRQIQLLPSVLAGYGQSFIKVDGVESDDVLAKYAKIYGDDNLVMLMAEDKDVWQNIIDYREDGKKGIVSACRYSKGANGFNQFDMIFSDFILEKFGIQPYQLADYLALNGDVSDNIPGVKGIGKVTAQKLLVNYGNINNIILAAEEGDIKGKNREKILAGKEDLIFSKKLTLPFLDFDLPSIETLKPKDNLSVRFEAKKIVPPSLKWEYNI